jgi:hypothetical protein
MGSQQISTHLRRRIFERDGYLCFYCDKDVSGTFKDPLHSGSADHLLPVKRGGTDDLDNLVTACRSCNSRKSQKTLEEYRAYVAYNFGGYAKARDLLLEALQTTSTPFETEILNIIDWLSSQIPTITFPGEKRRQREQS